ncbi:hypothetical protein OQA88_9824 [Cercophora sp. LCS_1]
MAGPRAPFGSLSDHDRTAAMLASKTNQTAGPPYKSHAKAGGSSAKVKVEDSDSSSDSDSSDESDNENGTNSTGWAGKLRPSAHAAKIKTDGKPSSLNQGTANSTTSDSEDGSSSEEESEEVTATKNKLSMSNSTASDSSSSDSDDESDSGAKIPTKNLSKRGPSKGQEQDSEESESESESESSDGSESEAEAPKVQANSKNKTQGRKETSGQVQANGASESGSSDSESESESAEEVDQFKAVERSNGNANHTAAALFGPSFQLRRAGEKEDAAEVARIFKNAKAEGKQVWYFTAPASVPIEVIQERAIVLDQLNSGHAIASHNGANYNTSSDDTVGTSITLVIPSKAGNKYEALPVDRSIHIKTITRFGDDATQAALVAPPTQKTPRAQPKGLKARYQPLGAPPTPMGKISVDASSNSEDVDMDDAPLPLPSSETPKGDNKKRKHSTVETPGQGTTSSSGKRGTKKARVDVATSVTPGASSQPSEASKTSKKAFKETPIAPPIVGRAASSPAPAKRPSVATPSGLPNTQPTKSQRAVPSKVTPIRPPTVPGVSRA